MYRVGCLRTTKHQEKIKTVFKKVKVKRFMFYLDLFNHRTSGNFNLVRRSL
jgi:hypothetical protein